MLPTTSELAILRKTSGRFALQSNSIVDVVVSSLFGKQFGSRRFERGCSVIASVATNPLILDSLNRHGVTVLYVDVALPNHHCYATEIEEIINETVRAVIVPNTHGIQQPLFDVRDVADEYGLVLIGDAVLGNVFDDCDVSIYVEDRFAVTNSPMVYSVVKSSRLFKYTEHDDFDESTLELRWKHLNEVKTRTANLDAALKQFKDFVIVPSLLSGDSLCEWFPVTLNKRCHIGFDDFAKECTVKRPDLAMFYETVDIEQQPQKFYGAEDLSHNTVLLSNHTNIEMLTTWLKEKLKDEN